MPPAEIRRATVLASINHLLDISLQRAISAVSSQYRRFRFDVPRGLCSRFLDNLHHRIQTAVLQVEQRDNAIDLVLRNLLFERQCVVCERYDDVDGILYLQQVRILQDVSRELDSVAELDQCQTGSHCARAFATLDVLVDCRQTAVECSLLLGLGHPDISQYLVEKREQLL